MPLCGGFCGRCGPCGALQAVPGARRHTNTRPAGRRLTASLSRAHIRVVAAPAGDALRIAAVGTADSIMATALDTHAAIKRLTAAELNTTQAEALPTTVSCSNPWAARETETGNTRRRDRAIHQDMAGSRRRGAARLTRSHRQDPATRCPSGRTHGSPRRPRTVRFPDRRPVELSGIAGPDARD